MRPEMVLLWYGQALAILKAQSGQSDVPVSKEQQKLNAQLGFSADGKFVGFGR